MKKNLIYLAILLILAGLAYFLYSKNRKGGSFSTKDFAIQDTSSITKIFLADKKGNKVTLYRKSISQWTVNNENVARPDAINMLLKTIHLVEIKSPIPKKAHNTIVKDMAARAIKVEVYTHDNEEPELVYYVGGATHDDDGSYMIKDGDETPFICYIPGFHGYLTTRYFTTAKDWRDAEIFRYSAIGEVKSVSVEYPKKPELSFRIDILTNNSFELIALKTGQKISRFDTLLLKDYLSGWRNVNFEAFDYLNAKEKDSVIRSIPETIYRMTKKNGRKIELKAFLKRPGQNMPDYGKELMYDADRMHGKLNNEPDLVLIQYFMFDKLTLPINYFIGGQQ